MPLLHMTAEPSARTRRWFGLSLSLLIGLVGYLLQPTHAAVLWSFAACGAALAVVYYTFPKTQLPVIRTWQWLTAPIAWSMGHALLLSVYWCILLPLAIVLRLRRHDPLALRKVDRTSNWVDRAPQRTSSRYFKQY